MKFRIFSILIVLLSFINIYAQNGDAVIEGNLYVKGEIITDPNLTPESVTILSTETTTNTFTGWAAGRFIRNGANGAYNAFFGTGAGTKSSNAYQNTFIGHLSGYENTNGSYNTFVGYWSGLNNTTGETNTFIGQRAGQENISGDRNSFIGSNSGQFNTDGLNNTFIGYRSGRENTGGDQNVYIGNNAGRFDAGGNFNVFIGSNTDAGISNCSNSIGIGNNVHVNSHNRAVIGNSSMYQIGGYASWTIFSDRRFKKNIQNNVPGLDFVNKLNPVTYNIDVKGLNDFLEPKQKRSTRDTEEDNNRDQNVSINDAILEKAMEKKSTKIYTGLIAQEVEEVANSLGYDFSGVFAPENDRDHYRLSYAEFVVPLIKAVQEQQIEIEILKNEIANLKALNLKARTKE